MATFSFRCATCAHEFETWLSSYKEPNPPCSECLQPTTRQIAGTPPVRLLGAGWAVDGYSTTNMGEQRQSDKADRKQRIVSYPGQKVKGRDGL